MVTRSPAPERVIRFVELPPDETKAFVAALDELIRTGQENEAGDDPLTNPDDRPSSGLGWLCPTDVKSSAGMDQLENDSETSPDGRCELDRWRTLRDAARLALATAEYSPGATPWAEIPPFEQAMMIGIKMAYEDEDFHKEVAKHIS